MALVSVIRRWHKRDGVSIREISRRTKLSRNTIRKYLSASDLEPGYPRRKSPSQLDAYAETLVCWLEHEAKQGRKQRRNLRQLHGSLVALGYRGSYDRVAAFARAWRQQQADAERTSRGAYVPLVFAPGEAFQFDWSEDWAIIGRERTKLAVAQFKLCYSRAFVLRAYPQMSHEMLFDAHNHAFSVLGGVARRGIYDNMKTAVDKIGRGKQRTVNARFQALTAHYLFEAQFCTPAAGWEKGQIEKNVRDSRTRLWQPIPSSPTLSELNAWLEKRCTELWSHIRHPEQPQRTLAEVWNEERDQLMAVPAPFDGFIESTKRVSPTCLVAFERNRYSVPAAFANRPVSLHAYAERIKIIAEAQIIAEHDRVFTRGHDRPAQTIYNWRHYLAAVQRKPGALRNGAPFAELPAAFKRLQTALLKRSGGDRDMVDILSLVLHHDEQAVLRAVEQALDGGALSKAHILNILSRLVQADTPAPVTTPPALALSEEPVADTGRYDKLRRGDHVR